MNLEYGHVNSSSSDSDEDVVGIEMPTMNRRSSGEREVAKYEKGEETTPADKARDQAGALASDFKTFGNTIISFIGSGILGLPFAFMRTGFMVRIVLSTGKIS